MAPHAAQVLNACEQPSMALHVSPPQHPCPIAPQGQTPLVHAPPPGHAATHVPPAESQQPLVQASPAQHAWPAPPHWLQIPLLHTSPTPHARPGQQACPAPPHAWQTPPMHAPPEQVPLLVHAEPSPTLWEQPTEPSGRPSGTTTTRKNITK